MLPFTVKKVPYDVQKDFTAVSHLGTTPPVLYVNGSTPITNLRQLFDVTKMEPEAANYDSYGNGSSAHVLREFLIWQLGVKMVHLSAEIAKIVKVPERNTRLVGFGVLT
ncbi:MAG: tripartite tricarboxylate transporter substrate-binding protein [Pseudomonadota bacterium]